MKGPRSLKNSVGNSAEATNDSNQNNYDKDVFNGDIGQIDGIDSIEKEVRISFEGREVVYDYGELDEIALAYAITIHKSQGSEFPAVVIPIATQQYLLSSATSSIPGSRAANGSWFWLGNVEH